MKTYFENPSLAIVKSNTFEVKGGFGSPDGEEAEPVGDNP